MKTRTILFASCLLLPLLLLTACADREVCDSADATFVVDGKETVRIRATLRTRGRHDGVASYVGSWTYATDVVDAVAIAIIGPGTHEVEQDDSFSGGFAVEAREDRHEVEILIQRLDDSDVLAEGELSAEAKAPDGCSLELEIEPE